MQARNVGVSTEPRRPKISYKNAPSAENLKYPKILVKMDRNPKILRKLFKMLWQE